MFSVTLEDGPGQALQLLGWKAVEAVAASTSGGHELFRGPGPFKTKAGGPSGLESLSCGKGEGILLQSEKKEVRAEQARTRLGAFPSAGGKPRLLPAGLCKGGGYCGGRQGRASHTEHMDLAQHTQGCAVGRATPRDPPSCLLPDLPPRLASSTRDRDQHGRARRQESKEPRFPSGTPRDLEMTSANVPHLGLSKHVREILTKEKDLCGAQIFQILGCGRQNGPLTVNRMRPTVWLRPLVSGLRPQKGPGPWADVTEQVCGRLQAGQTEEP